MLRFSLTRFGGQMSWKAATAAAFEKKTPVVVVPRTTSKRPRKLNVQKASIFDPLTQKTEYFTVPWNPALSCVDKAARRSSDRQTIAEDSFRRRRRRRSVAVVDELIQDARRVLLPTGAQNRVTEL